MLYPLTFNPVLKDYIWGGRNLETKFGRTLPPDIDIAESWEIAAHPDGQSTVEHGAFAGQTLTQVHEQLGLDLIGTRSSWAQERGKFPLLIKLLDANRELSVQVHPNDAYALANEGNELGKTEIWYVLHAEPDAAVILGVKEGTTPEKFRAALEAGQLEPHLHYIPVQAGDFVYVPAGSMHAILKGLCVAEVQQNSNTTYRVYDWNRMGKDGNPRPLHVEKALDVINFDQVEPQPSMTFAQRTEGDAAIDVLAQNRYFTLERVSLAAGGTFAGNCDGSTFEIWGCIDGEASVSAESNTVHLPSIRWTLLPAALGEFTVSSTEGCTLLRAYVEDME